MKKIIDFLWNVERVQNFFLVIALFLAAGTAWVSALKFYFELRVALEDLRSRFFRREEFKVKRTILKAIAKDNQTQIIKLRTLRVFKDLNFLDIDQSPERLDENDKEYVEFDHVSIPGVVRETHTRQIRIDFRKDELPKARQDYTYVTSQVLKGTMQDLWGEPGIVATKPIGSEGLTVEFFCAPRWRFKRNSRDKPEIKVYYLKAKEGTEQDQKVYMSQNQITSDGGSYAFDKTEGEIDWIRVIVKKPPQDTDVHVDWLWDEATQKRFSELEAAKLAAAQRT